MFVSVFDVFVPHAEVDFWDGTNTKIFLVLNLRDEGKGRKRKEGRKKKEGKKKEKRKKKEKQQNFFFFFFFFFLSLDQQSALALLFCSLSCHVPWFCSSGLCFVY